MVIRPAHLRSETKSIFDPVYCAQFEFDLPESYYISELASFENLSGIPLRCSSAHAGLHIFIFPALVLDCRIVHLCSERHGDTPCSVGSSPEKMKRNSGTYEREELVLRLLNCRSSRPQKTGIPHEHMTLNKLTRETTFISLSRRSLRNPRRKTG